MEPISLPSTSGMNSNANLHPSEGTFKAIFNPIEVLSKTFSFYGLTRAWRVNSSQDPTFMEPISLPSTIGMTSNTYLQPSESTSKAIFNPFEVLSKTVSFYGLTRAWRANSSQDPTFNEPISLSSINGMTSNTNLQPSESTSKAIFKPTKVILKTVSFYGQSRAL